MLALDTILGALTGASAALIGVGFLGSFTFVAFVIACQAVTGLPGTGLAVLVFVFTGNAVSGATIPFAFLPDGFRQIAPWLPNGAVVSAARNVGYFPQSNLGHPLLVLGIWRRRARHTCGGGSNAREQRLTLRWAAALTTASRARAA